MKPCTARISQPYGQFPQASGQPWIHVGDDYAGERGQEVLTIAPGVVLFAGPGQYVPNSLADLLMLYRGSDASGNCVIVQHDGWVETFNHLEFYTVNTGDTVRRGWRVGGMGDSGNAYGVHLHHETLTIPAANTPPFSRYNPQWQIDLEDRLAAIAPQAKETDMPSAMNPKEQKEFAQLIASETWKFNGVPNSEGGSQTIWRVLVTTYHQINRLTVTVNVLVNSLSAGSNLTVAEIKRGIREAFREMGETGDDIV